MRRVIVFFSIAALALTGVLARGLWPHAAAQDAQSAMATHPVVGTWWWENISDDPFDDSYAVFQADGTYVEATSYIGTGIGSWVPTGERTADLIIIFQDTEGGLDPTAPAAFVAGTITFRLAIEVDETGNAIVSRGPSEVRSPDGTVLSVNTYDFLASRVEVGWALPAPAATPAP